MSRSVKKVLIVEDDLSLRPLWENYFKSSRDKIWIEWAVSCEQALVIIAETNRLRQYFTLIVSDIFLAGSGTGLDLMIPLTPDAFLFSLLKKIVPTFIFQRLLYYFLPGSVKWGGQWKAADKATAA